MTEFSTADFMIGLLLTGIMVWGVVHTRAQSFRGRF